MKRPAITLALFATTLLATALPAANASPQIKAAHVVGFGTTEAVVTIEPRATFEQAITSVRAQLAETPTEQAEVTQRAFQFVYGTPSEADVPPAAGELFTEQVSAHLEALAKNKDTYQKVLQRAYRHVVSRDIYEEEIAYWSDYAPLPYALLVGCVEDWARRNQPGLMSTAGTPTVSVNSELLETLRLSPELAREVAAAMGLPETTTVLAAGGDSLKSSGDIRFLVIGER
jgi:hypothetical protein